MEHSDSQDLDEDAFLTVSITLEVLFVAKVMWNVVAYRHQLQAAAYRSVMALCQICQKDGSVTPAEEAAIAREISEMRLRMARRYVQVLAATSFAMVLSIQRNLILDSPRWMTAPLTWLVLGIFALLVIIQLHSCMLSVSTLSLWYVLGTIVTAVGFSPLFVPAEQLTILSVVVLVLFRLPFAIMAQHPLLTVAGNLVVATGVYVRTTFDDFDSTLGAWFTVQVEVSCSLMVITMSFILQAALQQMAQQFIKSVKAATELNAASAPSLQGFEACHSLTIKAFPNGHIVIQLLSFQCPPIDLPVAGDMYYLIPE